MNIRRNDPTYISFFILGGLWAVQFILIFIMTAANQDLGEVGYGEAPIGIIHAAVLLIGAYEDLVYGTHHLKWIIVLSVFMNFILELLALLGIFFLIAVIVAACIGGYILSVFGEAAIGFIIGYTAMGGTIGSIIMFLMLIGTIISGLITMSSAW